MLTKITPQNMDLYGLALAELNETIARLIVDGVDVPIVIAALAASTAETVMKAHGVESVAPFFVQQAALCQLYAKAASN